MKAFACWSGGKESMLSLCRGRNSGIDISHLVNMVTEDGEHSRTHGLASEVLRLQAESMNIRLRQRKTSWEDYENQFKEVVTSLKEEGIEAGIFGDIDLQGHRDWVERVSGELGIEPVLPLWGEKRRQLMKEFLAIGCEAVVVATRADTMGEEWLGRRVDEAFLKDLGERGIDLCGEGGEYHTLVTRSPLFRKPLAIVAGKKRQRGDHWFLDIPRAELIDEGGNLGR